MIRRRTWLLAALAAPALHSLACDLPTSIPRWEQTWAVPGDVIELDVVEFLPGAIRVRDDRSAFETDIAGFESVTALRDMCAACVPLHGFTAAKPEFTDTIHSDASLPADLIAARLAGDHFDVVLQHNLSFDPLRPSSDPAAPRGYILIEVTSAGAVVARDSVSGDDVAFDSTVVLRPSLAIQPVEVSNLLEIRTIVHSPAGDPREIDVDQQLEVALRDGPIFIAEATVAADQIEIDAPGASMEFGGLDSAMVNRVQRGELQLDVENPFGLDGTLSLVFVTRREGEPQPQEIAKPLALPQGSYRLPVDFTGDQLRRILGSDEVEVRAAGTLSSTTGELTVTPNQRLLMDARFVLVILVGPAENGS